MKGLADFGLEKIPTEVLLSMARAENGKLQSYIAELEDRLDATRKELRSLKAFLESDYCVFSRNDRKRIAREMKEDECMRAQVEKASVALQMLKDLQLKYYGMISRLNDRIAILEDLLTANDIALPDAPSPKSEEGDASHDEATLILDAMAAEICSQACGKVEPETDAVKARRMRKAIAKLGRFIDGIEEVIMSGQRSDALDRMDKATSRLMILAENRSLKGMLPPLIDRLIAMRKLFDEKFTETAKS